MRRQWGDNTKMNLKVEVDESDWGSYPAMGFGISYREHLF